MSSVPRSEAATYLVVEEAPADTAAAEDLRLVQSASLVIEARVISREPAAKAGRPAIDYSIEVDQVYKGNLPGSTLMVRLPGGVLPDGSVLKIAGVPSFGHGERLILFLVRRTDGTLTLMDMTLGAFRFDSQAGGLFWRDLSEVHQLSIRGGAPLVEKARRAEEFRLWLRDAVAGDERPADYFMAMPSALKTQIQPKFQHITSSTEPPPFGCGENGGHRVRWFDFDRGGSVPFFHHRSGQPGLDSVPEVLKHALTAWNEAPGTRIRYERGGETAAAVGMTEFDGINTLLFEDPNDEIAGSFEGGGFLALGGPWFSCDLVEYQGELFHPIFGADIITQDGLAELFDSVEDPLSLAEELFAHELGHTLGLAHSEDPDALMFADLHGHGRGATLATDDLHAIQAIYGDGEEPTAPLAPSNLWAAPLESSKIRLTWQDNAQDETGFRVDLRLDGTFVEIPVALEPNTREINISGLEAGTEYIFRVRAVGNDLNSVPSNTARARTLPSESPCVVDENRLCLLDGRFEVQVRFRNQHDGGTEGVGKAVPATSATGLFWFFQRENIELTIKILDGTAINGHFWVIYGALSDVEYWIDITDHQTGEQRVYHNPPGELCGQADSQAFEAKISERFLPRLGKESASSPEIRVSAPTETDKLADAQPVFESTDLADEFGDISQDLIATHPLGEHGAGSAFRTENSRASIELCEPTNERLCLLDGRFSVEVEWSNEHVGQEGFGQAIVATENSGYFWFFGRDNLELSVKILDGSGINGNFWFFYGALTDLEYWVKVTHLETGESRTYHNPPGEVCGRADIAALVAP